METYPSPMRVTKRPTNWNAVRLSMYMRNLHPVIQNSKDVQKRYLKRSSQRRRNTPHLPFQKFTSTRLARDTSRCTSPNYCDKKGGRGTALLAVSSHATTPRTRSRSYSWPFRIVIHTIAECGPSYSSCVEKRRKVKERTNKKERKRKARIKTTKTIWWGKTRWGEKTRWGCHDDYSD